MKNEIIYLCSYVHDEGVDHRDVVPHTRLIGDLVSTNEDRVNHEWTSGPGMHSFFGSNQSKLTDWSIISQERTEGVYNPIRTQ